MAQRDKIRLKMILEKWLKENWQGVSLPHFLFVLSINPLRKKLNLKYSKVGGQIKNSLSLQSFFLLIILNLWLKKLKLL